MVLKEKEYQINFPVLNYGVSVIITSDILKSRGKRDNEIGHDLTHEQAAALHCYNSAVGHSWIFLPSKKQVDLIAHESFHCIRRMFEWCSIGMENETWAFHMGYLINQVYKLYK